MPTYRSPKHIRIKSIDLIWLLFIESICMMKMYVDKWKYHSRVTQQICEARSDECALLRCDSKFHENIIIRWFISVRSSFLLSLLIDSNTDEIFFAWLLGGWWRVAYDPNRTTEFIFFVTCSRYHLFPVERRLFTFCVLMFVAPETSTFLMFMYSYKWSPIRTAIE